MRYLIALTFLCSCADDETKALYNRIVTDSDGCKYIVIQNVGDTVFLRKVRDVKCITQQP